MSLLLFKVTMLSILVINCLHRQAADLNRGLGASATQQAVVQSFLKNYDQVLFACCLEFLDRVDIMSKVDAVMKPFAFHIDTLGSFVGS